MKQSAISRRELMVSILAVFAFSLASVVFLSLPWKPEYLSPIGRSLLIATGPFSVLIVCYWEYEVWPLPSLFLIESAMMLVSLYAAAFGPVQMRRGWLRIATFLWCAFGWITANMD